jgi:quercetin dioxygenase-like cupin family protein
MADKTVVLQPDEGTAYWLLGGLYEVKATGDETGGKATIMEITVPEGSGPPPHTHPGGEAVYVLEGTLRYHIGDDVVEGGPGSFFYMPEGTWENFEPTSLLRLIVSYMPGGTEKFFAEAGEPARRREVPPAPTSPPDIARLVDIGKRHGMDIQPPA